MNDQELLEFAAKAAGITEEMQQYFEAGIAGKRWNPLTDDGDALRLAVTLKMQFYIFPVPHDDVIVVTDNEILPKSGKRAKEQFKENPFAATRRAIVRAAAEIGKKMENVEKA